ncbi:MAG: outer membrane lipoprotein carrier protein LolA [Rickettsiales bacterium]|nr:outer membrane lipoprotein carrier protein LolA [Rickettsiales bacterium]
MKNPMKLIRFCLFFLAIVLAKSDTLCAHPGKLSAEDRDIFSRANVYFKNIETFKGNFIQTNEFDQNIADGILYISRPNKFRFEYFSPIQTLIVGDGKTVSHYDMDLDEVSIVPASIIPMAFLMEKQRGLENMNVNKINIARSGSEYIIATEVTEGDNVYRIEYIFDRHIKTLYGINIYIDENQRIFLTLTETRINLKLNSSLFVFKNPRLHSKRK